jgi:hypothetical protein
VFEQSFEEIVARYLTVGLVRRGKLSVDGTFVEANASKESRILRGSWTKPRRPIERCASTWLNLKRRIQ